MLGEATNGYFTIDPDESGPLNPFPVWCNFSTIPATTLLRHDRYGDQYFLAFTTICSTQMKINEKMESPWPSPW